MQLVEPEPTRGGYGPADGGVGVPTHPMRIGLHPRPVKEILPYPINSNISRTTTDFSWVDTTPHGVESLASWGSFTTPAPQNRVQPPVQKSFKVLTTRKNGATRTAEFSFVYPNPGTRTFHLIPCLDTAPHSVTQPPGVRLIGPDGVGG